MLDNRVKQFDVSPRAVGSRPQYRMSGQRTLNPTAKIEQNGRRQPIREFFIVAADVLEGLSAL